MLAADGVREIMLTPADSVGRALPRVSTMFVCSPRPRVGKTLFTRIVVDFFLADDRPIVAFDANPKDPVLSDYLPELTSPATLADTRGQMALFDRLIVNDGLNKVVDLASDQMDELLDVLRTTEFPAEAKSHAIDTVVFFLAESHPRSLEVYRRIANGFPTITLVPVHNDVVENYGDERLPYPSIGVMPIRLFHLPAYVYSLVKKPSFSFAGHLQRSTADQTLHQWISEAFIGLRDLELRLSLADFAAMLRS